MKINPLLLKDFYKATHVAQFPKGTELVYSNFTPRKSRIEGVNHMVFFGLQYILKEYLVKKFNEDFWGNGVGCVYEYEDFMNETLGIGAIDVSHIRDLYELGYLPLKIQALPEGTLVPMGTPAMTLWNTHPKFYWLTNCLETMISNLLWKPCTSATTANLFRLNFEKFAELTGADKGFIDYQGHDFSYRGMSGLEDAMTSGAGHLLSFKGTDTIPAILFLKEYYRAAGTLIGTSVPATEHAVMCAGGMENEKETLRRLIEDIYPKGIVSVVSDSWDFWKLVTEYVPELKEKILSRWKRDNSSKMVIRPDSGTPHLIINGDPNASTECERKGLIRCLDETFGHTVNEKGFKRVHPCVGAIYGDSIDLKEQVNILQGLADNGYESTSLVMGIGSFAYQYVTRDSLGTVCKATYCEINGEPKPIFKSPKTGAWKKSHKGLLRVNSDLSVEENVDWSRQGGELQTVFENGKITKFQSLQEIRERLNGHK